jgi:hypothetical protein
MRWHTLAVLAVAPLFTVVGCGAADSPTASSIGSEDDAVVGGQAETRFAAVGFLMTGETVSDLGDPVCGATLVAPNAIITAAHCLIDVPEPAIAARLANKTYRAKRVLVDPLYKVGATPLDIHDVAVVILASRVPLEPLPISDAKDGEVALFVGYGRVTPGGQSVEAGYTSERKSATQRIARESALNFWTAGVSGGLCWGDSGGPLLRADGSAIIGVLADFYHVYECAVGNRMLFTRLSGVSDFVSRALACAGPDADETCAELTFDPVHCGHPCRAWSYQEGQCYDNWQCEKGCLVAGNCPGPTTCDMPCADSHYAEGECRDGWHCLQGCIIRDECNTDSPAP